VSFTSILFKNHDSRPRLILSIALAVIVLILLPHNLRVATRFLCAWNSGTAVFLALTWSKMLSATPVKMRRFAQRDYEGRVMVFVVIITAACASLLAIGFMLSNQKGLPVSILGLHLMLSVITIVTSWLLVHTIFTLQYAHTFYRDCADSDIDQKAGGLDFPDERDPDYWDFLYFSFVIGMTSQVSDIQTTSRIMRRLALVHGVLSFFFNTTILAMGINIIAGLIQSQG
jgi:uncharacterized membrane protein